MAEEELTHAYAQALYEKALEHWGGDLSATAEAVEKSGGITDLDDARAAFERKKELLDRLIPPDADPEIRNLVYLLASKNEVHLLPAIVANFARLGTRGPAHEIAYVTSAVPLTDAERKPLEEKIRAQFGRNLQFEYRVDKAVLGGAVIRIGDKVIDASVAGKLAAMRTKLEATR